MVDVTLLNSLVKMLRVNLRCLKHHYSVIRLSAQLFLCKVYFVIYLLYLRLLVEACIHIPEKIFIQLELKQVIGNNLSLLSIIQIKVFDLVEFHAVNHVLVLLKYSLYVIHVRLLQKEPRILC